MKRGYLFFLGTLFLLASNISYAEKSDKPITLCADVKKVDDESDQPLQMKLSDYNAYVSLDDKSSVTGQDDSDETIMKDPDKVSPYFEVGVRKKY